MISEFPQPPRLPTPVRITEQVWPEGTVPVVSIKCITYQHVNFIREAIEGFLMQETTFPVEILIHDDASTDGTADIVREYQAKYPQLIRAVHLHFVQSLEPLQGAGLGQAALSLHLAMRGAPGEGHAVDGIRSEAENQGTGLGEQRERTQKETHGRSAESPCVSREGLEVKGLEWIGLGWGGEREEGVRI